MNLETLLRRFRVAARDTVTPGQLFSDEDITDWLNDAQEQACIRGRLLRDDSTPEVTRIALAVGTHTYPLHETVYELIAVHLVPASGEKPRPLCVKSREWLDNEIRDWRTTDRQAFAVIQDDTSIRVVGTFVAGDRVDIECYRLPLEPMANDTDEPEIHRAHHVHLIDWALHRGFSIPDAESFDASKAEISEQKFTKYFGPLPNANLRRSTRHDVEHHNYHTLP